MINLRKNDALADAVKEILQQEALKGNQHLIDKNKNNEVDAHDFKILRGEKKAVKKEEVETVEEGLKDIAKKAFKALTGGSDEDQRKNLQKKMGVPQTGKKPTQKEEVEQIEEGLMTGITLGKKVKNDDGGHDQDVHHKGKKIGTISSYTHRTGTRYGMSHDASGDAAAGSRSHEEALSDLRSSHAEHLGSMKKEEVEQIVELSKSTLSSYMDKKKTEYMKGKTQSGSKENAKDIQNMGKAHDKMKKEEVQGKTLKQFKEGWDEMLADVKKRGEPQPNGGSGKKQGSAYGGSKQKDKPEQDTEKK